MKSHRRHLAALIATLWLAACAPTTELLRSSEEDKPLKPATTLLVAGVTTDDAVRNRYEAVFVEELARAGLKGVPSSSIIPSLAGQTMPQIRERMLLASDRADAVLHVQLVDLMPAAALSPGDVPADSPTASRNVGGVSLTLNAPAGDVRGTQYEVQLEANLYELPSRRLLWTVVTRTHESNAIDDVARSHARALIAAMRERGYVAGKP